MLAIDVIIQVTVSKLTGGLHDRPFPCEQGLVSSNASTASWNRFQPILFSLCRIQRKIYTFILLKPCLVLIGLLNRHADLDVLRSLPAHPGHHHLSHSAPRILDTQTVAVSS